MASSQYNSYIVAPDQLDVGVETIRAGSNVSLTGTSANPIINAIVPIVGLTAGSNITLSGTSNVTINATVPIVALTAGSNITLSGTSNITINSVQGPSGNNVPRPSSTPGTPVGVASITNTNQANFYTIATDLFPQNAGGTNTYRFTFNGFFGVGSIVGGTGGNIDIITTIQPSGPVICGTCFFASPTVSLLDHLFSMSGIFIPTVGDSLVIFVRNNTGGTLTDITLNPTPKGCGIELVSSNSAPVLIFS